MTGCETQVKSNSLSNQYLYKNSLYRTFTELDLLEMQRIQSEFIQQEKKLKLIDT